MKALLVKPGRAPMRINIEDSCEKIRKILGGRFEEVRPYEDDVAFLCNEMGKFIGMPLNRALRTPDGKVWDIIAGPFLVFGAPLDSEVYADLTEEQMVRYEQLLSKREDFSDLSKIQWAN